MGTTRIKVIDLSSDQKQVKTARKHAEKIALKPKEEKESRVAKTPNEPFNKADLQTEEPKELETKEKLENQDKAESEPEEAEAAAEKEAPKAKESKSTKEKTSNRHLGTKYLKAKGQIEKGKTYTAEEAVELLYKTTYTKFDPTVELHLLVVDKSVRGSVALPHATGPKKEKTYLVFSDQKLETSDKKVVWGTEATIGQIETGSLKPKRDFDIVIATPKFMPQLAKVAKILGPAGLMPNPKNKTVTENIKEALSEKVSDAHEYRTELAAPVIHTTIGKLSLKQEAIRENAKALIASIGPAKIKAATITSTMGPPIKFDPQSFLA